LYSTDLAYIHDVGFNDVAERAAPEVMRILGRHGIDPPAARAHRRRRPPGAAGRAPRIVDVGCGSGTLARRLVDRGYDVVGIDISPAMIRLARAKVPEARFRVGSLIDARIPRSDAVIAVGEVIAYVAAPRAGAGVPFALRRFFSRVRRALKPGGLLLFDFMESARRRTYRVKTRGGRGWAIAVRADVDRAGRVLTRRMITVRRLQRHFRSSREVHRVRVYSRRAIAGALTRAGFDATMSRSYGRYRLLPGDVAVVARKRPARARGRGPHLRCSIRLR
jgi:SAM-dependent methyltransferase